jgi:putative ABC transport system permease protein
MIKNYFTIAFRNITKNKGYALLNILGLSVGLTCFAFITLWVTDEISYDRFNEKADRIVRVTGKISTASEVFEQAVSPVPMAQALKTDYPEVENTVRLTKHDAVVKYGDQQYQEDGIILTDPSFFDVFSYRLKEGDAKKALSEPYTIILTESMAKKYFGNSDPINKSLTLLLYDSTGKGTPYKITGVIPDPPKNAHFTFNCLASFKTVEVANPELITQEGWGNNSYYTYLLLKDKADLGKLQSRLPDFAERHIGKKMKEGQMRVEYILQPLQGIHLNSHLRYEIAPTGSMQYIYIFSAIGIFILLIAGINYMNLSTAHAVRRAKEVGVKKVLGAAKWQLVLQYITEAIMITLFSLLLAFVFTSLLNPLLQQVSGKQLSIFHSPSLIALLFFVSLLLGILSGLYPAFFITAYKPVNVLKGSFKSSSGAVWLRKTLVVVQFTISVVLIVGILVVSSQLSYIKHKDLGYQKDALISLKVNGNDDVIQGFAAFKNALLTNTLVSGVTTSNSLLVGGLGNSSASTVTGDGKPVTSNIYRLKIENDFIDVYGITLVAGRNFSTHAEADSTAFLLNEAAVKSFQWGTAEKAIGKPFSRGGYKGHVIGIVKDFHFNSLQHTVEPLVMQVRYGAAGRFSQITVKADMKKPAESIAWIEKNWKKYFPGALMEYGFIDKKLNDQYQAEDRFGRFFFYFSVLSLLIACLGLFGLTAYATQQRTKEIGIRKILGASITGITALLSKDFLKLVLIAFVLAVPISWFTMYTWLQDFAYRITISWWVFAVAGIVAFLVALFTIGFQAIKAAMANPVKNLRTE